MKYEVILPYQKKITISEEEKLMVEKCLDGGGMIEVQGQWINTSSIRGIFEVNPKDQNYEGHIKESIEQLNTIRQEFSDGLNTCVSQSPEEKAKREVRSRAMAIWKTVGGKREDPELMEIYKMAKWFFGCYTNYPWYPVRFWFWIIEPRVKAGRYMGRYMVGIVKRHDDRVHNWLNSAQGIFAT